MDSVDLRPILDVTARMARCARGTREMIERFIVSLDARRGSPESRLHRLDGRTDPEPRVVSVESTMDDIARSRLRIERMLGDRETMLSSLAMTPPPPRHPPA